MTGRSTRQTPHPPPPPPLLPPPPPPGMTFESLIPALVILPMAGFSLTA